MCNIIGVCSGLPLSKMLAHLLAEDEEVWVLFMPANDGTSACWRHTHRGDMFMKYHGSQRISCRWLCDSTQVLTKTPIFTLLMPYGHDDRMCCAAIKKLSVSPLRLRRIPFPSLSNLWKHDKAVAHPLGPKYSSLCITRINLFDSGVGSYAVATSQQWWPYRHTYSGSASSGVCVHTSCL